MPHYDFTQQHGSVTKDIFLGTLLTMDCEYTGSKCGPGAKTKLNHAEVNTLILKE